MFREAVERETIARIEELLGTDRCRQMLADQSERSVSRHLPATEPIEESSEELPASSYPTASKERRKKLEEQAKQEGREIAVRKKKRTYDQQFDDCGESLSGLGEDVGHEFVGFELKADERDDTTFNELAMDAFSHP